MKKDDKLKEILTWILDNCDDTAAMDKINNLSFPYSSRYKNLHRPPADEGYYPGE